MHAIECKSQASKFESNGVKAFRKLFCEDKNILVTFDATQREERYIDAVSVIVLPIYLLAIELGG